MSSTKGNTLWAVPDRRTLRMPKVIYLSWHPNLAARFASLLDLTCIPLMNIRIELLDD